jgi:3-dehydroquinate synthase
MKQVKINLSERSYNINIGNGLLARAPEFLAEVFNGKKPKLFIITDAVVAKLYLNPLEESLKFAGYSVESVVLPNGEATKSFANLELVCEKILSHQPERGSCIIALGGGVIGDLAGFAASIILRGISFVQIPTTLLAMVDSSVGGKTAVNSTAGKNLIGSFYQPKIVIADLDLLKTLPEREVKAGFAEVIKYGLIDDLEFFDFINSQANYSAIGEQLAYYVEKSCVAKARIVSADEREGGVRALLNLGHTFAHALEAKFHYDGTILHGEAVGIGMVLAFKFSEFLGLCEKGAAARVETCLKKFDMLTDIKQLNTQFTIDELVHSMYADKKVADGKLTFILASKIGGSFIKKDVAESDLRGFLAEII